MQRTYQGVIALGYLGAEESLESIPIEGIKSIEKICGKGYPVYSVEPDIVVDSIGRKLLPEWQGFAWINHPDPIEKADAMGSHVIVQFFTDTKLDLSIYDIVTNAMKGIEWETVAKDWYL